MSLEACALCNKKRKLCNSHILPAFVFKWKKKTSGGVAIRTAENPNKRVQDGYKIKLLCEECEGLFNSWETEFSKRIFHPYNSDSSLRLSYSDWYSKFCVSVSWRILKYYILERNFLEGKDNKLVEAVENSLSAWRGFLVGDLQNPGKFEQHMLPLDALQDIPSVNTPTNINRFLLRNVEIDFVTTETNSLAMVYAKMGRFMLFGYVVPPKEKWIGTKIAVNYGSFGPKKYVLPSSLADFIFERARNSQRFLDSISRSQREKINQSIEKNIDKLRGSGLLEAMLEDARLFGEDVIIRKDD